MAILPDWCSCEVRGVNENNTLHQRHIQNCLWRETNEIKIFKDKVIEAILRKGGNNFKNYKNRIIQEIIQKAQNQGLSETELNNICPDWKNHLLSLNSPKEITDYQTNQLEEDIKKLVAAKNKSETERKQAEAKAQQKAKKEEERLKKEREEREKKEEEERKQKEKKRETEEKNNKAREQAKQQELKQKREKVIAEITVAVPDVRNRKLPVAEQILQQNGFHLGDVRRVPDPSAADTVIDYNPKRAATGSAINLVVSSGPQQVSVPRVICEPRRQAINDLQTAGLKAEIGPPAQSSICPTAGLVADQDPPPGQKVDAGSIVTLFLVPQSSPSPTTPSPPPTTPSPPPSTSPSPSPSPSSS